jgi:hypothetical protein
VLQQLLERTPTREEALRQLVDHLIAQTLPNAASP